MSIEEIISKIIELLKEIERQHREFAARIRAAVAKFFQEQAQQFEALLNDIARRQALVVAEIEKQLAQVGDPVRLHEVGVTWSKSVGAEASKTGGNFDLNTLLTDDEWSGIAADAYKGLVPSQKTALDAIKTVADKIQVVLDDAAPASSVSSPRWVPPACGAPPADPRRDHARRMCQLMCDSSSFSSTSLKLESSRVEVVVGQEPPGNAELSVSVWLSVRVDGITVSLR